MEEVGEAAYFGSHDLRLLLVIGLPRSYLRSQRSSPTMSGMPVKRIYLFSSVVSPMTGDVLGRLSHRTRRFVLALRGSAMSLQNIAPRQQLSWGKINRLAILRKIQKRGEKVNWNEERERRRRGRCRECRPTLLVLLR